MATYNFVFAITDQAGGTVTLTSSPFAFSAYSRGGGGDAITADTLEVRVEDGTSAANLGEIRTINRMLDQAREAQTNKAIRPVYLTWQEHGSADVWRSEITGGRASARDDALTRGWWETDTAFAPVYVERKNYWEGPLGQLPITNPNGTADTSGLVMFNANDGADGTVGLRYNWFGVAGTAIAGDLPAPVRLELTVDASSGPENLWIGHKFTGTPASFQPMFEGETLVGAGTVAQAQASGGNYGSVSLASGTALTSPGYWTIDNSYCDAAGGGAFHVFTRFTAPPADTLPAALTSTQFRVFLATATYTAWRGAIYQPAEVVSLNDIGTLRLPPWLDRLSGVADMRLYLEMAQTTGATVSYGLDYVYLMPADGLRYLEASGGAVPPGHVLVDDMVEGRTYFEADDHTGQTGNIVATGDALMLRPGVDQRLYFLRNESTDFIAQNSRTLTAKLYYRPRRRDL